MKSGPHLYSVTTGSTMNHLLATWKIMELPVYPAFSVSGYFFSSEKLNIERFCFYVTILAAHVSMPFSYLYKIHVGQQKQKVIIILFKTNNTYISPLYQQTKLLH